MIHSLSVAVVGSLALLAACAGYSPMPRGTLQEPVPAVRGSDPVQDTGEGWGGTAAVLIGGRKLDDDRFWDPVDNHFLLGAEFALRPRGSVLGIEFGATWSVDADDDVGGTGIDVTGTVYDFYVGPRLTFDLAERKAHPYVGAGVALVVADFEGEFAGLSVSDDDTSAAGYAHAGILFEVSEAVFLGIDGRLTFGSDVTLFGVDGDVDSYQIAALIGTSW